MTNNSHELKDIREHLLRTEWIEEAKQIPLYEVNEDEQKLLIKCIQKNIFTDEELDQLEQLLGRFRHTLVKLQPEETIENVENNITLIQDEKKFLQLLENSKEEQTLIMTYPLTTEVKVDVELIVNTEVDAQFITDLQSNMQLFKDYTTEEKQAFQDVQSGKQVTKEEQIIAERIQKEITEKSMDNVDDIRELAINFLANQTRFRNGEYNPEKMKEIFTRIKLGYLFALFEKVQSMIGVTDIDQDEIFR